MAYFWSIRMVFPLILDLQYVWFFLEPKRKLAVDCKYGRSNGNSSFYAHKVGVTSVGSLNFCILPSDSMSIIYLA